MVLASRAGQGSSVSKHVARKKKKKKKKKNEKKKKKRPGRCESATKEREREER
jgi:hypothetical protein